MDQHANARKVYFAAIFSFMAAVEVAFCAWFGLHHHAQLAGSLAGTAFLLALQESLFRESSRWAHTSARVSARPSWNW